MEWYARHKLRLTQPQELTPLPDEDTQFFYVSLGAGAIISPWNFALALTIGMMTPAVVTGNTVVVKPASAGPPIAAWLVDLFVEIGLPRGVINYITDSGGTIGDALVDDPRIPFVVFTGSKEVGTRIHERGAAVYPGQCRLKRIQLEMGGKNGIVVEETAIWMPRPRVLSPTRVVSRASSAQPGRGRCDLRATPGQGGRRARLHAARGESQPG